MWISAHARQPCILRPAGRPPSLHSSFVCLSLSLLSLFTLWATDYLIKCIASHKYSVEHCPFLQPLLWVCGCHRLRLGSCSMSCCLPFRHHFQGTIKRFRKQNTKIELLFCTCFRKSQIGRKINRAATSANENVVLKLLDVRHLVIFCWQNTNSSSHSNHR